METRRHRLRDWAVLVGQRLAAPGCPIAATSIDLCRDPALAALLGAAPALATRLLPLHAETIVGWGRRPSGRRAVRLARRTGARFLLVEDGFLRSAERDGPPLSLVLDDLGIHYDARHPSRLEALIAAAPARSDRARRLIDLWRTLHLSKIAGLPDYGGPLPTRYVLVIDQVRGDLSVRCGLADVTRFARMLDAARAEHPGLPIVLKAHPDSHLRGARGYLDPAAADLAITAPCNPARLIAGAAAVYTVTSQAGFEALLHGRPVRTFGMPFYAGWGLTEDDLRAPARRTRATLEALVHAALVDYPRYIDPRTGGLTDAETAILRLARAPSRRRAA